MTTPSIGQEDVLAHTIGGTHALTMISDDGRIYPVESAYDATRDTTWAKPQVGRAPLDVLRAARERIKELHQELRALEFAGGGSS
jgi:hypothetical protein